MTLSNLMYEEEELRSLFLLRMKNIKELEHHTFIPGYFEP